MGNLEKLSTLHPQNEPDVDLYPNIKLENIPQEAFDDEATEGSLKLVNSDLLYRSLIGKQDVLEFDNEPTQDSTKMVNSGGIYNYIQNLDIYQRTLSVGNLILIDGDNKISVDKSKISIDNDNTLLGNANFNNDGNTHITVVGYNNTIGNHPYHIGTNSLYNVVLGDKNAIAWNSSYNSLMGYDNTVTYSSQSIALGYKNSIGSAEREQIPDGNIIAIGSSNKVGDVSDKSCTNIIGIGNNINNQDSYTFIIDTNYTGIYGTNRSSLVGNLQGLYYNGAKMATESQVDTKLDKATTATSKTQLYAKLADGSQSLITLDDQASNSTIVTRTSSGRINATDPLCDENVATKKYVDEHSGGSPLQIHYIRQSYMTGDSSSFQTVNFAFYSYRSTSFSTYESLYTFLVNNNFTNKLYSLPCILAMGPGSTSNVRNGAITGIYADTTAGMIYGLYISYNSNYAGSITNGESVMQIKDPTNVSGSASDFTDTVKPLV